MNLHAISHHSRSHSNSGKTPDITHQSLASLVQASQSLTSVGNPSAAASSSTAGHQHHKSNTHNNPTSNLQVQTFNTGFNSTASSQNNSGITPIHSGGSSIAFSPDIASSGDSAPPKQSIAFQLPSPNPPPSSSSSHYHQLLQPQSEAYQKDLHASALQPYTNLTQRPADPVQIQQLSNTTSQAYPPYHSANPSSGTGSRPHPSASVSGSGANPQASQTRQSLHRQTTSGTAYSPNPSLNTSVEGSKKYTHPGALTPTYPSTSQHSSSQSHSGSSHLAAIGLSGLSSSSSIRDRDDNMAGGVGAVGVGRWMNPYTMYAIDWCKWSPSGSGNGYGRVAVGSYAEDSHNYIQILDTRPGPVDPQQPNARTLEFTKLAEATHTYPITRVLWEPPSSKPMTELLATSGDHLRLWTLPTSSSSASPSSSITSRNYPQQSQKLTPLALLSNSKSTDFTAPLTSLDWNQISPSLIITSSIDTTCTIWDIPTLTAKTQLIAHDKEVFDVRFMCNSVDIFASCGADGSVRMFDLRSLEHSTIIYEPGGSKSTPSNSSGGVGNDREPGSPVNSGAPPALLRLAASPHDQHLLATFCTDSNVVRILDIRQPGQALVELKGHTAAVNCCEWNPGRRGVLAAGGDDCEILVWDIYGGTGSNTSGSKAEKSVEQDKGPIAWWGCEVEVNNLSWSPSQGKSGSDWIGVVGGRGVWGLGV